MAEHRETFGEDVGGKLLLLASMLAVFGVIALVLMPLGAAFAPPPAPPAAAAAAAPSAEPPAADSSATPSVAPAESAPASATPAEGQAAAPVPEAPPPFISAFVPGIIMLVAAAVLAALAGLLLGHAKARSEEVDTTHVATPH